MIFGARRRKVVGSEKELKPKKKKIEEKNEPELAKIDLRFSAYDREMAEEEESMRDALDLIIPPVTEELSIPDPEPYTNSRKRKRGW